MPTIPCFNSLAADRYAAESEDDDAFEEWVDSRCEAAESVCRDLFALIDASHAEAVRETIRDFFLCDTPTPEEVDGE